jgi:hypothetical protein
VTPIAASVGDKPHREVQHRDRQGRLPAIMVSDMAEQDAAERPRHECDRKNSKRRRQARGGRRGRNSAARGVVIAASLRAASFAASTLAMSIVPRRLYTVYSMGTHVQTGAPPL